MQALILYFLKVNIVISVLFLLYLLLLKNEKFFNLNRFLLLSIIVSAFVLPVVPISTNIDGNNNKLLNQLNERLPKLQVLQNSTLSDASPAASKDGETALNNKGKEVTSSQSSTSQIAITVYLLVSLVFFIGFAFQLIQLFRLLKGNETKVADGIIYHTSDKPLPPFSFFNHLVISKLQCETDQMEQIIAHEKAHIKQFHMIDILLGELVQILLWINPLVWMLNRYIKLNLEYIADKKVLDSGVDRKDYQINILTSCLNPTEYRLANLFSSSKIKLRIKMMNAKHSPLSHLYKYALILPVAMATYLIISPVNAQPSNANSKEVAAKPVPDFEGIYVVINGRTEKDILEKMGSKLKDYGIDFNVKDVKYNAKNQPTAVQVEVNVPGVFKGNLASGDGSEPLSKNVVFFHEKGGQTGLVGDGSIPEALSKRGKLVVDNNLTGALILFNDRAMTFHGAITTKW